MDAFQWTSTLLIGLSTIIVLYLKSMYKASQELKELPSESVMVPRGFTLEELEEWDGVRKPLAFMGIKGVIYSVSLDFYGKGAAYNAFAGRDSSRHLGKTVVGRTEANADWTRLSQGHLGVLQDWDDKLSCKYAPVGWIINAKDKLVENAKGLEP